MSWFWPFRKNTEPPAVVGSTTTGATPKSEPTPNPLVETSSEPVALPVALPVENSLPVSLKRSCVFAACGVPNSCCLPVALSCCLPCRPLCPLKKTASESLATPPLEIRSVDSVNVSDAVKLTESDVTQVTVIPTKASSPDTLQSPLRVPAEI